MREFEHRHIISTAVRGLIDGDDISVIAGNIASLADKSLDRAIEIALDEMGEPPAGYAFIVMGSEGRREQTLATDQDNAIIIDCSLKEESSLQKWFLAFGRRVNDLLNEYGYAYCKGEVMARNPDWCVSVERWTDYFSNWIERPTPKAVMRSDIFFDFRLGHGDHHLTDRLQAHLREQLSANPARTRLFYRLLGENARTPALPARWWSGIWASLKREIELKKLLLPATSLARILALQSSAPHSGTIDRLIWSAHHHDGLKTADSIRIRNAWSRLMLLRLSVQLTDLVSGDRSVVFEWFSSSRKHRMNQIFDKLLRPEILADIRANAKAGNAVWWSDLDYPQRLQLRHDIETMRVCQSLITRNTEGG